MIKYISILLTTVMCLVFSTSVDAQILDHSLGQLLIKTEHPIERIIAPYQEFEGNRTALKLKKTVSREFHIYLLEFDHGNVHEERFLSKLRNNPMVSVAQYNHILSHRAVPNDPQFDNQWQYINTGQSGGTVGADLDMDLAWDVATGGLTAFGDTIVAAIIDDGFDWTHEDFGDNLWVNYSEIPDDGIDNDNNGYVDDYRGWNAYTENDNITGGSHGTPVTGIIGAKGNNGIGVAGVNWDVKLMIIQGGGDEADAIAAYSYCYTQRKIYNETSGQKGTYVVTTNSSWGTNFGQPEDAPLWCAFYDTLGLQGIVSCGATINGNQNVDAVGDLPTKCPSDYLIAVTNMNRNDQKVSGAGYGVTSIDLGAFGAETWTTRFNNEYTSFGGTSGATPHVAGTVALMHSAPCPSFAAFAKSDPAGSALLIKQYILDGVDPNASLANVSVTGGRLNASNAMNAMVDNCDPNGCFTPYAVVQPNTTGTSSEIMWQVGTDTDQSDIRYRIIGTANWIYLPNVVSPYTITGLHPCSNYEFQIKAICDNSAPDWTNSFSIKTDGCCEAPASVSFPNTNESSTDVSWNPIFLSQGYELRYKATTGTAWTDLDVSNTNISLSDLEACTLYEFQIRTNCESGVQSDYSESFIFSTRGCGACIENNYCPSYSENASLEWLESVVFNTINNVSGADGGFADFTGFSTDVEVGQSYDIILTPGYLNSAFSEYFMVWIDFNQDGDFDDTNEVAFDAGTTTLEAITGNITIPSNSAIGPTRMRVSQKFNTASNPCDENYNYGEVEDYCINIITDPSLFCEFPSNVSTSGISETSVDIAWDDMANALSYEVRYKIVGAANWTSDVISSSSFSIANLIPCSDYEIQVKTICNSSTTDWINSIFFKTVGCCEAPADVSFSNTNPTGTDISWDAAPIAQGYDLRYKAITETVWIELSTSTNNAALSDLVTCTAYELQIRTNCQETVNSDYSESYLFSSSGCGACIDSNYCASNATDARFEWIESVVFNTINNVSGENSGYAGFSDLSTDVELGYNYYITLTPGFREYPYDEYFMVWIDFNQDGDFDDADELAFDAGTTSQEAISGLITIPSNSVIGATRMRISQRWNNPSSPCAENYDYGEVEDYCINIIMNTAPPCNIPANISISDITETTINVTWDDMDNALDYEMRYKETASANWISNIVSATSTMLTDLTPCTDYEIQVRTICDGDMSDYSISFDFTNICTAVTNISNELSFSIHPNPVSNELVISLENGSGWSFALMDVSGKIISKGQSSSSRHSVSMSDYPAGIYFIQAETEGKRGIRKIVKL